MSESKTAYGRGFAIRLTVLLIVLAALAGLYYYETKIARPANEKKVAALFDFVAGKSDGLTRAAVRENAGVAPSLSEKRDRFDVDCYSFRTLPFLPAHQVFVVFENDLYYTMTTKAEDVTAEKLKENARNKPGVRTVDVIPEPALPAVAGGGAPGVVDSAPGAGDGGDGGEGAGNDEGDAAGEGDAGKEGDAAGDPPAGEGDGEKAGEGAGDDGAAGDPPASGDAPKSGDGAPAGGDGNAV